MITNMSSIVVATESQGLVKHGCSNPQKLLVAIQSLIWEQGYIPQQMQWVIVVLLPKGDDNFQGIGLLEPFWKVIEVLMDKCMDVIEFHDCLHGFLKGWGTGTAMLDAKLAQQLAYLEQETLYEVFAELKKAYYALDRDRCLEILKGCRMGPLMLFGS